jgi:cysteine-rich repeat protein
VVCDDQNGCTEDLCDATSGCAANPNTEPCDDGNACTVQDACAEGSCQGTPAACDDGIACTADSCDPGPGCVNTPQDGDCDDGLPCTDGVCHAGQGCAQNPVENCCGNGIVEGAEVCDDNNSVDGDGCSAACESEVCYDDWLVGSPCNGTDFGNGCDPDLTGYHYRGHFGGWECWWHTRNQAWNTSSASNHYNLAMEFGLTPSQGWCSWCHDWTSTPSGMSEGGCGYLGSGNSGAWGWCAESQHWDGGWICFPSGGLPACANASQWP